MNNNTNINMVENEAKGWYGSFSNAGRNSAEKYNVIVHKDEILNNENKRIHIKSAFTPDEELSHEDDSLEDHVDIFKISSNTTMVPSKSTKKLSSMNDRLKFHNKHIEEQKKNPKKPENPPNKYNPKMDYIWSRTISGPQWRPDKKLHKCQSVDSGFYMKHEENINVKGFIELSKQTMRGDGFPGSDVRLKHQKKFERNKGTESSPLKSTFSLSLYPEGKKSKTKLSPMKISAGSTIKVNSVMFEEQKVNSNKSSLDGKKCYVPDFKKNISREMLEAKQNNQNFEKDFCNPQYNVIRERQVMLVTYAKPSYKRKNKEFIGIDPGALDKINGQGQSYHVNVPIFKSMVSRPVSDDPLPSYMKQIYSRASGYSTTDKTLKMNNYANSKFIDQFTSFYPKKSFNKAINLNLMSSEKFNINGKNDSSEFNQLGNYLAKAMNFYRKNYDDLEKTCKITKFDGVTLKAIPRKNRNISNKQLQNFLVNFDLEDHSV